MADILYYSLWYTDFEMIEMLPHALRALQQFVPSKALPGITQVEVHPISWNQPTTVRFIVRGAEFEEGEAQIQGEIQVDFGLDVPFLHEELDLTAELESRV